MARIKPAAVLMALLVALPGVTFAVQSTVEGGYMGLPPADTLNAAQHMEADGGFENGFAGWTTAGSCWAIDTTTFHSGSASATLNNASCASGGNVLSQSISQAVLQRQPVMQNGLVRVLLSAWVKTSGTNGPVTFKVESSPYAFNSFLDTTAVPAGSNDWTQVFATGFVAPTDATIHIDGTGGNAGQVWIDDIQLTTWHPPAVRTWLRYPNYRGLLFDPTGLLDTSQTIIEHVHLTAPFEGPLPAKVIAKLTDATSGATLATATVQPVNTADFDLAIDGSAVAAQPDKRARLVTTAYGSLGNALGDDQTPPADLSSPAPAPSWQIVARGRFPDGLTSLIGPNNAWWNNDTSATASSGSSSVTVGETLTLAVGEPVMIPAASLLSHITAIDPGAKVVTLADNAGSTVVGKPMWVGHFVMGGYLNESSALSPPFPGSTKNQDLADAGFDAMDLGDSLASLFAGGWALGPFNGRQIATSATTDANRQAWVAALPSVGWFAPYFVWDAIGNSVTGSVAAGSANLVVSDVTHIAVGDTLVVSGAGQYGRDLQARVSAVDTATKAITLDRAAAVGVSSATVWIMPYLATLDDMGSIFSSQPGAVAYYVCDECNNPNYDPVHQMTAYDRLRTDDPNHFTWSVLLGVGQGGIYDNWWDWIYSADVVAADSYPIARGSSSGWWGFENPPWYLPLSGRDTGYLSRLTAGGPLFAVQQMFSWFTAAADNRSFPTGDEWLSSAAAALIAGARGLMWWNLQDSLSGLHVPAGLASINVSLGGTVTSGDRLTVTVNNAPTLSPAESVSITAGTTDTLDTLAAALAGAINADTKLTGLGIGAQAYSNPAQVNIYLPAPKELTAYATTSLSAGATETLSAAPINADLYWDKGLTQGSIAAGQSSLAVDDASLFSVNDLVDVAGAGTGGSDLIALVTAKNGSSLTLNVSASTSVTEAEVRNANAKYNEFRAAAQKIKSWEPAVLGADDRGKVEQPAPDGIAYVVRDGSDGHTWIIAQNQNCANDYLAPTLWAACENKYQAGSLALAAHHACFNLNLSPMPASVTVVGEGRTIAVSGGQLCDDFSPWQAHVYQF